MCLESFRSRAKVVKHRLPVTRNTIKVQAGTQYIDGFWCIMRAGIRPWRKADAALLHRLVRVAQFRYWIRGKDTYLEAAKAISASFQQYGLSGMFFLRPLATLSACDMCISTIMDQITYGVASVREAKSCHIGFIMDHIPRS